MPQTLVEREVAAIKEVVALLTAEPVRPNLAAMPAPVQKVTELIADAWAGLPPDEAPPPIDTFDPLPAPGADPPQGL